MGNITIYCDKKQLIELTLYTKHDNHIFSSFTYEYKNNIFHKHFLDINNFDLKNNSKNLIAKI